MEDNNCDLLLYMYEGALNLQQPFYQGWKDQMARISAYAVDVTLIALTVHIGEQALPNTTVNATWINVQGNYIRQLQSIINRIVDFDQASKNNAIWNAQRNLNLFIARNITDQTLNKKLIADMSYDYLTQIIPTHRWMIYVYTSTASASANSWRCTNCFVSYNYRIPYSILVIGVPYSSFGNPSLL